MDIFLLGSAAKNGMHSPYFYSTGEHTPRTGLLEGLSGSLSGPEEGVITKGDFSLAEESLESLESLDSLKSLDNGRILLCFPQSGGSLEPLKSLNSLESLENGLF